MSKFLIFSPAREPIGLLQNDISIIWLENYQSPGEAKITARATPTNIAMLVDGNRIYNADSNTVARICHTETVESGEEVFIEARADLTAELLSDRVVMATENVRNVEAGMYSIYSKNRRALPIDIAAAQGYTETTETEITWNSVLEAEITLAESSGLGFTVDFDPETAVETFRVYRGTDRSVETSDDYVGYFGTDAANIFDVQITSGTTDFKNVAVVAGEGEGSARTVRIVSLGNVTGENRRELYVDARDIQREYQVATLTGYDEKGNPTYSYETKTYTAAQYNALLDARGYEKLAEHLRDFGIACDIEQNNIVYGEDYFLGDRMPIKLPTYGIAASAVISSVRTEYESTGKRIIATLNNFRLEETYG